MSTFQVRKKTYDPASLHIILIVAGSRKPGIAEQILNHQAATHRMVDYSIVRLEASSGTENGFLCTFRQLVSKTQNVCGTFEKIHRFHTVEWP